MKCAGESWEFWRNKPNIDNEETKDWVKDGLNVACTSTFKDSQCK